MNDAFATPTNIPDEASSVPTASGAESPGTVTLGRYLLGAKHAEGGLGEVFRAIDTELNRDVALKRIKALNPDADRCRRFLVEGEVTGRLEHPGVVPVYGLGHDAAGRPFYVMRFVRGETLQEAIQRFHAADRPGRDPGERSKALRELLGQFVATCNTMAYAHSRGILHRDLKPSNIMLGPYGETLVVDWGLAKPFRRSEEARSVGEETLAVGADDSQQTQQGQAVGTPQYMSPEQAAGRWSAVGPASDVYSLGATLYHLLAGKVPFDGRNVGEVLDKVRRGAFPPPSQRKPDVPRALEAVCLKAMALEPEERYASALDLAAEVKNWLADEPVGAWREPWRVRTGRWVRRHPSLVTGSVAAVLLAAVVIGAVGAVLAALERERQTKAEKELTELKAQQANNRARENYEMALTTSDELVTLADSLKPLAGTRVASLQRLLDLADKNYGQMLTQAQGDPALLERTGRMLNTMSELYQHNGDTSKSLDRGQQARKIFDDLLRQDKNNAVWQRGLAFSLERIGWAKLQHGNPSGMLEDYRQALAMRRHLAAADTDNINLQLDLFRNHDSTGDMFLGQGDHLAALEEYRHGFIIAKALYHKAPTNAKVRNCLGLSYRNIGDRLAEQWPIDLDGVFDHYQKSLTQFRDLTREEPNNSNWQYNLMFTLSYVAWVYKEKNDIGNARKYYEESLTIAKRFADLHPESELWKRMFITCKFDLVHLPQTDLIQWTLEKIEFNREYRAFLEYRIRKNPYQIALQRDLAAVQAMIANDLVVVFKRKKGPPNGLNEAAELLKSALLRNEELRKRFPDDRRPVTDFNDLCWQQFNLLTAQGKNDEAHSFRVKGVQTIIDFDTRRADLEKDNIAWKDTLAHWYGRLAEAHGVENPTASETARRESVRRYQQLADLQPSVAGWQHSLADALVNLYGILARQPTREMDTLHVLKQVVNVRETLVALDPKYAESSRRVLAVGYLKLAQKLQDANGLDPMKRAASDLVKLRASAMKWLRAELDLLAKKARANEGKEVLSVVVALSGWRSERDFASVRDHDAPALQSPEERKDWQKLWADAEEVFAHAQSRFRETESQNGKLTAKENSKAHEVKLTAGTTYVIELRPASMLLKLEDAQGKLVNENDHTNQNSRIVFNATTSGSYRIVASPYNQGTLTREYVLLVFEFVRP